MGNWYNVEFLSRNIWERSFVSSKLTTKVTNRKRVQATVEHFDLNCLHPISSHQVIRALVAKVK